MYFTIFNAEKYIINKLYNFKQIIINNNYYYYLKQSLKKKGLLVKEIPPVH